MGDSSTASDLAFTLPFQLTQKIHRREVPYILSAHNPENDATGKIVLITGGGTGIGAAAARVWVKANARAVIITGRRLEVLEKTAVELQDISRPGTAVVALKSDITDNQSVKTVYDKIKVLFGRTADVVIANAGISSEYTLSAADDEARWWSNFVRGPIPNLGNLVVDELQEINVRGLRNTIVEFIRSQDDPLNATGTVIEVNTGLSGLLVPGMSGYASSKLVAHRFMEFVAIEYPKLRAFTALPGIVDTGIVKPPYLQYAQDHAELTGSLALYLSTPRAEYLRGSLTSVNWDYEEMEAKKEDIEKGLLRMKWVPVLPCSGGQGI